MNERSGAEDGVLSLTKHHLLAQRVLSNFDRKRKGIMSTKIELLVFPYLFRDFSSKKLIFLRLLFHSVFQLWSSRTLIKLHPTFDFNDVLHFGTFSKHEPFFPVSKDSSLKNLNLFLDSTKAHFIRCTSILPSIHFKDFDITDVSVVIWHKIT